MTFEYYNEDIQAEQEDLNDTSGKTTHVEPENGNKISEAGNELKAVKYLCP